MGTSTTTTSFKQKIFLNTKQREQLIISTKARVMLIDAVVYSRPGLHETGTKSDRIEIVGVFTLFCVYAWDFAKLCMCFVKRQTGLRKRSDKETPVPVNIRTGLKIVISVQNRNDFEPPSEHFPASWKQLYNRQHYTSKRIRAHADLTSCRSRGLNTALICCIFTTTLTRLETKAVPERLTFTHTLQSL